MTSKNLYPFWVSWHHDIDQITNFELHYPWWISGSTDTTYTICAAIMAENEEDAKNIVLSSFDFKNSSLLTTWRFVDKQAPDWSPFCDRFAKADWMSWPYPTCACSLCKSTNT